MVKRCICILLDESIKFTTVLILPFLGLCRIISWTCLLSAGAQTIPSSYIDNFPAKMGGHKEASDFQQA